MPLDPKQAIKLLQADGPLAQCLKGFESRAQQQEMMHDIIEAYNHNQITLIEAGTGTGKSLAYLIPAMLWAGHNKEKTVISTNTITLQEQLIHKDIPLLSRALNIDIKAVLVKGMSNYVCMRKMEEVHMEIPALSKEEGAEIEKIEAWRQTSQEGSRSELPFIPSPANWERVCAESDTCNSNKCPYYQQCYFFKARKQAQEAQLLVVNHHLLFADLIRRANNNNYKDPSILPPYDRIILDEAHHIEDIATEYFAAHLSRLQLMHTLGRLTSDKYGKQQGKLPLLKLKLSEAYKTPSVEVSSLLSRLNIDLPGNRNDLLEKIVDTFEAFAEFIRDLGENSKEQELPGEQKIRLLPLHQARNDWNHNVVPRAKLLIESAQRYIQALSSLEQDIKSLENDRLNEQTQGVLFEIAALARRLTEACAVLSDFVSRNVPESKVRWVETSAPKGQVNIRLVDAELDVSQLLAENLFSKFSTIVLCSATLTTSNKFDFIRNRLGLTPVLLPEKKITQKIYHSPFNYPLQALLAVPTDISNPSHPDFIKEASANIWQAIQASRGNAFVLFTSYGMLKTCYEQMSQRLRDNNYHVFKQGDDNRKSLLQKFAATDRSVLFGTDSFWEGVDVVGEALRCVIIVKLPFKVPTEPIIQARCEAINANGGDSFLDYSLPNAIVKFKQGFGRLIRNKNDRGCIVCLDSRLINKAYGRQFLNSLPSCQQVFIPGAQMGNQLEDFYRKTYHLVKNRG